MIETLTELLSWLKVESVPALEARVGDIVCREKHYPFKVARTAVEDGFKGWGPDHDRPCKFVVLYDKLGEAAYYSPGDKVEVVLRAAVCSIAHG